MARAGPGGGGRACSVGYPGPTDFEARSGLPQVQTCVRLSEVQAVGVRAGAPGRVGGGVGAEWSLHIGSGFRGTSSRLPGPHLAAPSYPFFPREGRRRWFSEETRRRAPAPPPPAPGALPSVSRGHASHASPESRVWLGRGEEEGPPASQGAQGAGGTGWVWSSVSSPETSGRPQPRPGMV